MNRKVNENSNFLSSLLVEWGDSIIRALIIIIFILAFVGQTCTVVGNSMLNTLHDGEKLVISNLFYTPKENDIIVFHQTGALNEPVVKRIIATENKWVRIDFDRGLVYVSTDDFIDETDEKAAIGSFFRIVIQEIYILSCIIDVYVQQREATA